MPVDLDDLKHKLQALGPAPWRHAYGLAVDFGYVDAQEKYTILWGDRCEGAVDEDNPEGIALVAMRNAADELIADLEAARAQAMFYRRRCEALQQWQSHMRDPERTVVCDILANGSTLPDAMAGDRYKVKEAPLDTPPPSE